MNEFRCPKCGSGPEALACIMRNVGQEFLVDWDENGMPTPGEEIETFYDTAVTTYLCRECGAEYNEDQIVSIVRDSNSCTDTKISGKLKDADAVTSELQNEAGGADTVWEFWDGDTSVMTLYGPAIHIPAIGLKVYEGTHYLDSAAEFDFTAIYKEGDNPPAEPEYWEQDPIVTALYNYLTATGRQMPVEKIEDLEFTINKDE